MKRQPIFDAFTALGVKLERHGYSPNQYPIDEGWNEEKLLHGRIESHPQRVRSATAWGYFLTSDAKGRERAFSIIQALLQFAGLDDAQAERVRALASAEKSVGHKFGNSIWTLVKVLDSTGEGAPETWCFYGQVRL